VPINEEMYHPRRASAAVGENVKIREQTALANLQITCLIGCEGFCAFPIQLVKIRIQFKTIPSGRWL
jgi:hypothetical protein